MSQQITFQLLVACMLSLSAASIGPFIQNYNYFSLVASFEMSGFSIKILAYSEFARPTLWLVPGQSIGILTIVNINFFITALQYIIIILRKLVNNAIKTP